MGVVEKDLRFVIQLDRLHPRGHEVAHDHAGGAVEAHAREHGREGGNGDGGDDPDDGDDDHHLHQGKTGLSVGCICDHAQFPSIGSSNYIAGNFCAEIGDYGVSYCKQEVNRFQGLIWRWVVVSAIHLIRGQL